MPGDIPLVQPEDFAAVLELAPSQGTLLVPWDGRGTNAVLRSRTVSSLCGSATTALFRTARRRTDWPSLRDSAQ